MKSRPWNCHRSQGSPKGLKPLGKGEPAVNLSCFTTPTLDSQESCLDTGGGGVQNPWEDIATSQSSHRSAAQIHKTWVTKKTLGCEVSLKITQSGSAPRLPEKNKLKSLLEKGLKEISKIIFQSQWITQLKHTRKQGTKQEWAIKTHSYQTLEKLKIFQLSDWDYKSNSDILYKDIKNKFENISGEQKTIKITEKLQKNQIELLYNN